MNKTLKNSLFSPSLHPIIEQFDHYIVDLWGVIHDGQHTYPGVKSTLELLRNRNKKVIFLSNAPRRAHKAAQVLEKLGITSDLYDTIITSGEITHQHIKSGVNGAYYYIGPEKDRDILEGLPNTEVADATAAQFALVTGFDNDNSTLEEKQADIDACLSAGLPLICANPDIEVVRQDGTRMLCAGVIAEEYARLGGKVTFFGKPHPDVYSACFAQFGQPPKESIVAIGDNLFTDIKGAQNQGIFSVLCTAGILAETLGINPCEAPPEDALRALYQEFGIRPDLAIASFNC